MVEVTPKGRGGEGNRDDRGTKASCRLTRRVLLITFLLPAATSHTARLGAVAKDTLPLGCHLNCPSTTLGHIGRGRGWLHIGGWRNGTIGAPVSGVLLALRISLEGIGQVCIRGVDLLRPLGLTDQMGIIIGPRTRGGRLRRFIGIRSVARASDGIDRIHVGRD